jgi:hypothetical protein
MILPAVAVLFASGPAPAATTGKLVTVTGKVWLTAPGKSEKTALAGIDLAAGTRIRTGNNGSAEVAFADGSRLRVRSNSSLKLSGTKRQKKRKSSILLFFGRVWSKVTSSVASPSNYEVTTPNAVCGVRGTEFETAVADDGSVRVRVTSGRVGVGNQEVAGGGEVEGDERGVNEPYDAEERAKWEMWQKKKRERLRKGGRGIIDKVKTRLMTRKQALERLRAEQQSIETQRKSAERRVRAGDSSAIEEIRKHNQRLAEIADQIADLGDMAEAQFGMVDHVAELAADPRFKMIDRKYLKAEAASLMRVKKTLDKLVAEGTDISMEAMDRMLDDMGRGKPTLKDDESAADDLFGPDGMDDL